jgi:hypothetical protein
MIYFGCTSVDNIHVLKIYMEINDNDHCLYVHLKQIHCNDGTSSKNVNVIKFSEYFLIDYIT